MGNYPNAPIFLKGKLLDDSSACNTDCKYCTVGVRLGWPSYNVLHTHLPSKTDEPTTINHLKELRLDVDVTTYEVEGANAAIHKFFKDNRIIPKIDLRFDIVILLAKLCKFKIEKPFYISEETERMIAFAKIGKFPEAFKILDEFPAIVNYIPSDRAWGLLHQAAYFNNYVAVKKILENPKCDPFLRTKQTKDGVVAPGSTAFEIATEENVKKLIKQNEEDRNKSINTKYMPTFAKIKNEKEIKVGSILLTLGCFENVLHPQTLNSEHSLIYSNLMLDIFEFIDSGSNWKRARREVALQLQSIDVCAANFLATGNEKGDIMDSVEEEKSKFYSRVICLYTKEARVELKYTEKNRFYKALNFSFALHGHAPRASFVSGEDLALAGYGILLNAILMYWTNTKPTVNPTFRGMHLPDEIVTMYEVEDTFTWLCFTSTSVSEDTARRFMGNCLFICDNTLGTKYAAKGISGHSGYDSEREYLYPSGARFRITSVEKNEGVTYLWIRLEDYEVQKDSLQSNP